MPLTHTVSICLLRLILPCLSSQWARDHREECMVLLITRRYLLRLKSLPPTMIDLWHISCSFMHPIRNSFAAGEAQDD
jgi:hypothetical protein